MQYAFKVTGPSFNAFKSCGAKLTVQAMSLALTFTLAVTFLPSASVMVKVTVDPASALPLKADRASTMSMLR